MDDGWLPQLYMTSDICGPTAEAMVIDAVISAKRSSSLILPGRFTSDRFVAALPYPGETAVPLPLHNDGHSLATPPGIQAASPTNWQMSAADIQRVINVSTLQKTDPTHGGSFDTISTLTSDFSPVATYLESNSVDAPSLVSVLRQRYAAVIALGFYDVGVQDYSTATPNGNVKHHVVNFTRVGGHAIATDGFTGADSGTPTFFLHDPWYGQPRMRSFIMFDNSEHSTPSPQNQAPLEYTLPGNGSRIPTFRYPNRVTPTHIRDLINGDQITFVEWYGALHVD